MGIVQCVIRAPDASMDALCADPPYGLYVGTHSENVPPYPAILQEAARVAKPNARFVLITQEIRLLEKTLVDFPQWKLVKTWPIARRGLRPHIYLLQRSAS
ncbi:hypothetical protein KFU94_59515 [Chloroflexi bacterium TSY]|nr:hypothetical protein [Chloroflexi bacterium TSY]